MRNRGAVLSVKDLPQHSRERARWFNCGSARGIIAVLFAIGAVTTVLAQEALPRPELRSNQKIGRTAADSGSPVWPQEVAAPERAPNVLVILTDDVGFGASSAFGGPIPTPTLEGLAAHGLRYNRFNTTALCSPTRAALLTGREPHSVAMGNVNNLATGYEGYNSVIPKSAGMIAEVLRQHGYGTAAFGKWHLTPEWEQSEVGPFDRWPTGEGFEYFYGFQGGDTDQYAPALFQNTLAKQPPADDPGYILDHDLADQAITWIGHHHDLAPRKPFFVYYATGSAHSPHSAPRAWLERFRGRFDQGWDVARQEIFARQKKLGIIPANTRLTPRPDFLPAWSSLSADQRRIFTRMMEAYAAALSYSDDQVGRIIQSLRDSGQLDNTLIVFIEGDNGSSAEGGRQGLIAEESMINGYEEDLGYLLRHIDDIGGPKAHNHFPAAWAWAMNTPFQYYKQVASHFGGIRNGMVVSWPERIKDVGTMRSQFLHVVDVVPTILEAVGIEAPTVLNGTPQARLEGASFAYSFDHPDEPSHRHVQVFEMMQNLAIYDDGWWAGTRPAAAPWDITLVRKIDLASRRWELYHVSEDFSQANDLAESNPRKLAELQSLFFEEAQRNKILPIHSVGDGVAGRPSLASDRKVFTFHAGLTRVPENTAPRLLGKSYTITADVVIPSGGANGVLITQGGRFGGYALYVKDGFPTFFYNTIDDRQYPVRASERLTPGPHTIVADFSADNATPGAGGNMVISVDGRPVGSGRIEHTHVTWISNSEGLDVGEDTLTPINGDYTIANSRFTGELKQVTIRIK